jgi:hypothetical protein
VARWPEEAHTRRSPRRRQRLLFGVALSSEDLNLASKTIALVQALDAIAAKARQEGSGGNERARKCAYWAQKNRELLDDLGLGEVTEPLP